ncbi:hypothetical protein C731_2982 [Mycolicibacterium hassiacum DSM 44199]|uniref:Uncharacterized protein n=1 Tax=Mycolicibacterium hassiacum (strain DSM 44199 / CIP 105218 / JCM 12690 / 3849) TaxID=1122247 RepID=K5BJE6_MYCHD|nr:hypothetical protein [Mycolicibacterium hassiacum]EKF22979.1 hypothetical protein C731_2982 [Mycolicibacterium hassiacum DSM 44199]MDA4086031.1 hypothetical protein [Mycolicibacterium hassiacum DSM 44199]VCT89489.1 hypothetical protein MHAS_01183 [Mycolicibacterium hassiacum DSM 44199]
MTVIQDSSYNEVETRLQRDLIVVAMSIEMLQAPADVRKAWTHDDGGPTFEFMQMANREYRRRGGTDGGHIGAIANALLKNLAILEEGLSG